MVSIEEKERLKDFYEFFLMLRKFVAIDVSNIKTNELKNPLHKKNLENYIKICQKDYSWSFMYFKEPYLINEENYIKLAKDIFHMNLKIVKFFEFSEPIFKQYYPDFINNKNSPYNLLKQKHAYLFNTYLKKI